MIQIGLVIILAVLQAVQETLNDRFNKSIFRNLDEYFWNPKLSWRNKYVEGNPLKGRKKLIWNINRPVQISDAFHIIKTIQVTLLAVLASSSIREFILLGIIFNIVFGIGYHWMRRDSKEVIRDHYPILQLLKKLKSKN